MNAAPDEPDPLPTHDANAELQRQSIHALFKITQCAGLLLRDERSTDYGVDASFEIVVDGRPTNYRSQVQIKSTARAEINVDGSTSKEIEVSNLNYLLNGTCPIYLFYCATQDRFWYTWAFDELRRLESENPQWKNQKTITIRFSKELTKNSLREIHSRIATESGSRRVIADTLARYTIQEAPKFRVDPKTLATESGERVYKILISSGFDLVSSGHLKEVLAKVDLLPFRHQRKPRIQLLMAYAYYMQGRPLMAFGHCAEAQLRAAELTRGDREVLLTIRDACECHIGKIDRVEYAKRQMDAAGTHGASLQCRIEAVRFSLLCERDERHRSMLLTELRVLSNAVLSDPTSSVPFKIQTRMHLSYAEGTENQLKLGRSITILSAQYKIQKNWANPDSRPLGNALVAMEKWNREMKDLVRDAETCGVPWLFAEVRRTSILVQTALLGFRRYGSKFMDLDMAPKRSEIESLIEEANEIVDQFKLAENIEGEMRTWIAIADLYEIIDDVSAAKEVASRVKPIAEALGLSEILSLAEQHLNGKTLLQATESKMRRSRDGDQDVIAAEWSDEDIDRMSEVAMASTQLPLDRLPNLRQDFENIQFVAMERLHWCKHIGQIQNLFHSRDALTAYAAPPEWFTKCGKHNYESLQGATDMNLVMQKFKKTYCEDCRDRDPKLKKTHDVDPAGA